MLSNEPLPQITQLLSRVTVQSWSVAQFVAVGPVEVFTLIMQMPATSVPHQFAPAPPHSMPVGQSKAEKHFWYC
jgi:hypothetical protein